MPPSIFPKTPEATPWNKGAIQATLEPEFPAEEASRQLDILIHRGRYAEGLPCDDDEHGTRR